jgi:glucokinase
MSSFFWAAPHLDGNDKLTCRDLTKMATKKKYVIGIDLGGTKILVGLLDGKFNIVSSVKAKMIANKGEPVFFNLLVDTIEQLIKSAKVDLKDIQAIGMGCPGLIDSKKGIIISSPNINFMKNYPLSRKLSQQFKLPIALANDVSVGLYGEHQFGAAKGFDHVVGIFLGTGVGGALVLNGKLYHGSQGGAGEIGHTLVNPFGALCGCGKRGCLETEISRPAIAAEAAVLSLKHLAPHLSAAVGCDIAKIKSGELKESIENGDENIKLVVKNKAQLLGVAMANIVNILNPELIVLGGGVIEAVGKIIVPEAEKSMLNHAMPGLAKHVKVVPAKLKDYAAVMGAAKMAMDLI